MKNNAILTLTLILQTD